MPVSTISSRPPAGQPEDYKEMAKGLAAAIARESSKFAGDREVVDSRVTRIMQWVGGILGSIGAFSLIALVSTTIRLDKSVQLLLERPLPVSQAQYDRDSEEFRYRLRETERKVTEIQLQQATTINEQARP